MNIQPTFKLTILPLAIMLLASQLLNPTDVQAQGPPDGVSGPGDGGVIDPWGGLDCINGYAVLDGPWGWYCTCDPGWIGSTCNELDWVPNCGGVGGVRPQETVPYAPSNVTIIEKTETSIKLEWRDRSSVEAGFKLERQESWGDWVLAVDHLDPVDEKFGWSNYLDEPLTPDTQFCYRVVPYNDFGSPLYVPEVCAYTDCLEPTGAHLATLRVLTHNVYGFQDDGIFGDGGAPGLGAEFLANHCEERAKVFGETVAIANPSYDIVSLHE